MINDLKTYRNYFISTFAGNPLFSEIKSVVFGGTEQIINRQVSELHYPLLWVEPPTDIHPLDEGGRKLRFKGNILVLQNAADLTWDEEIDTLDNMFHLIQKVLTQIENNSQSGYGAVSGQFEFHKYRTNLRCKERFSGDIDFGWEAEIEIIGEDASICDKW